jgi:uncharacterized protein with beta-barrel porin domain
MKKVSLSFGVALAVPLLAAPPAQAQVSYLTLQYPGTTVTGATGLRGDNMTSSYLFNGGTGGLLYRLDTGTFQPYPVASAGPSYFPGASSTQPYGPGFGSPTGILRSVGTFIPTGGSTDSSFIYDNAAAPGQQITVLNFPGASNTVAHSQFGNQVVGNINTNTALGTPFIYNIANGTWSSNSVPLSVTSSAYGIWADRIAGGFTSLPSSGGLSHGYIYNETTRAFTTYDAPGTNVIETHFEGITAGGRANEFNLVASSVDASGLHAWAVHVDANGNATWVPLSIPGSGQTTTGNSIYEDTAIGIYSLGSITGAYIATVPGLYTPVRNTGTLTLTTPGIAISALNGDDVVNTGTITTTAANSIGIASGNYAVIQNSAGGVINAMGPGSAAVQMNGQFGTFLNRGLVTAAPGSFALLTGPTAFGTTVVNDGVIDGQVSVTSGPFTRFEINGVLGISAPGSGTTHTISGVFAQTASGVFAPRIGSTTADLLQVNGQARLAGGVLANVQSGSLANSYTILSASGGYTGTFATLATQNLPAFLSASLSYGSTSVTLGLQSSLVTIAALGGDQLSVGRALDWAFNAGPGLSAMPGLFTLTSAQLPSALATLSGDSASVQQSTAFQAGGQFATLLSARPATRKTEELAQAPCASASDNDCESTSGWGFWANAFGGAQWLNADSSTGAPASQSNIGGGAFGADYRAGPDTLVGVAVGLSGTTYWMPSSGATGRATGVHIGVYGAQTWNGFYANAAIAYSIFNNNQTRFITGIGNSETEQSSGTANQLGGRLEVGHPFNLGEVLGGQVAATPFLALQPQQLWSPFMVESSFSQAGGSGSYGLTYQSRSTFSLPLSLGGELDGRTEIAGKPLNAWVRAAWVHEFLTDRSVVAGFNVLPGTSFLVDGARAASDAARIALGLKYAVGSQTSLFADGNVELSGRGQSLAGTIGLRYAW